MIGRTLTEKLATLAILLLAKKADRATTLTDGIDLCDISANDDLEQFIELLNSLESGQEYGAQVLIPKRIIDKLEYCYLAPQEDHSIRGYEVNAIMVKK